MIARLAPTAAEAREVTASAIDDTIRELEAIIRELQATIRYLELRKAELDRPSPPFTTVFPPRGDLWSF